MDTRLIMDLVSGLLYGKKSPTNADEKTDNESLEKSHIQSFNRPGRRFKSSFPAEAKDLNMYVLGCADDGVEAQKQVAKLMDSISARNQRKPDVIIFTGDYFKRYGADAKDETIFDSNFHSIYQNAELKMICDVPCLLALGNHDLNARSGTLDFAKGYAQINHSFINLKSGEFDKEKIKLFDTEEKENEKQVELKELATQTNKWTMFSYFSYEIGETIELFFLNSSAIVKDYVAYLKNSYTANNQYAWFVNHVATSKAETKILFLHHPPITIDKRGIISDAPDYLQDELDYLEKMGIKGNYNQILNYILFLSKESPGVPFKFIFAAHHHAMHLIKDGGRYQIVSGGCGGPLQNRWDFSSFNNVPAFIKDFGFTSIEIPAGKNPDIKLKMYTINNLELHFESKMDCQPLLKNSDENFLRLRDVVLEACYRYQAYLSQNPPKATIYPFINKVQDYVTDDVAFSDILKNEFNQINSYTFQQGFLRLQEVLKKLNNYTYYPKWQEIVGDCLKQFCGLNYEDFTKITFAEFARVFEKKSDIELSAPKLKSTPPMSIPVKKIKADEEVGFNSSPILGSTSAAFFHMPLFDDRHFSPSSHTSSVPISVKS